MICLLLDFIVATMATASVLASIDPNKAAWGHCQPRVCSWKMYSMTGISKAQLPATTKNARDMQCMATCKQQMPEAVERCVCLQQLFAPLPHLFEQEEVKLDSSVQEQWWQKDIEKQFVWLNVEPQSHRVAQAS